MQSCSPTYEPGEEPSSLQEALARAREHCAVIARSDPAAFNEFVLRDDEDPSAPFENAPAHDDWHKQISHHPRLCVFAGAEGGKTISVSVGRVLYELGRNPNLRVAIVSETDQKAEEIVETIRKYIEESAELALVFPKLRPAKAKPKGKTRIDSPGRDEKWTMHRLTVERSSFARDPSVRACGVNGTVQGARVDLLIVDDVVTWRTARTNGQRKKLSSWFKQSLASRLTRRSRVVFINTAYHPDDLVHEYARRPGYVTRSYPLRDRKTGKPTWSRFDDAALAQKIHDMGGEGSPEVTRQVDCIALREGSMHFPEKAIERTLELGDGLQILQSLALRDMPEGAFTITGVDLGIGKTENHGRSCIFTILVFPYGARFSTPLGDVTYEPGARQVIAIESGHWDGPDIIKRCRRAHNRFGSVVFVEDNAAQMFLIQFMGVGTVDEDGQIQEAFPVIPHHTGTNKWNPAYGITAIGTEMAQGKWLVPNDGGVCAPEVSAWLGELTAFDPDAHTGDRLMAGWIASTGARQFESLGGGNVGARVLGG